ncbi:MAG TPA: aromatic-ring-hydroxylating dioxygenase subunit beta [Alphaproteobacteria bacterium]|nr:aromatic-ring-hydroxylating dioxygenase subunit beta [Alphaproteobacteria bacterium]
MTKLENIAPSARVEANYVLDINDLLDDYTSAIDRNDLEQWPELFVSDGCYRVLSRENVELGLTAPLVYYYSQGMMRDRVTALRDALTYEFVYTRHVTSPPRLRRRSDGDVAVASSFSIFQSTEEGVTRTFAVGAYEDIVTQTEHGVKFRCRDVMLDSFGVLNNIAIPL